MDDCDGTEILDGLTSMHASDLWAREQLGKPSESRQNVVSSMAYR